MKSPIAALVLISSLAASPAWGQAQAPTFGGAQPNPPRSPITDAGGSRGRKSGRQRKLGDARAHPGKRSQTADAGVALRAD